MVGFCHLLPVTSFDHFEIADKFKVNQFKPIHQSNSTPRVRRISCRFSDPPKGAQYLSRIGLRRNVGSAAFPRWIYQNPDNWVSWSRRTASLISIYGPNARPPWIQVQRPWTFHGVNIAHTKKGKMDLALFSSSEHIIIIWRAVQLILLRLPLCAQIYRYIGIELTRQIHNSNRDCSCAQIQSRFRWPMW